jgi:HAD superfamily hydrolase (TIGR01509 family)
MAPGYYRDHLLGRSDREIIEHAVRLRGGRDDQVDDLLRLRQRLYQRRVADDNPIGAATVALVELLAAHSIPLGIVTGAQRDDVLAVLAGSPVGDVFRVLVAEEDIAAGKPDPQGYLAGAAQLHRRPQDVLVFEDSVPGVQAALAAGMRCIAVAGADPNEDLRAAAPAVVDALSPELVADALGARR